MKLVAFLNISILTFCLIISCGNDASKKTTGEKTSMEKVSTDKSAVKSSSSKSSLTATVPVKTKGENSLTATVPVKKTGKGSLTATVPLKEDEVPPKQLKKAKEMIASVSQEEIEAIDAKKKFKMLCSTCHGFKGDLNVNGAKDLSKSNISLAKSVARVYFGKGLMTPFKGVLTDAEIVAVSKYTESLRN